jgi:hypothetical protein
MANTKTTTSKSTASKKQEDKIAKLEKQIAEQQNQISQLIEALQGNVNVSQNNNVRSDDLGADEEILVVSLTPNKLNLVGDGGVVLFSFDNMYEEQYIDYASLKEIVRLNRVMAKNGRFYIMDERAVNKLRLKNDYKSVLSPEQLKKLLVSNTDSALDLYKLANDSQKRTIIEMVKQFIFNGKAIDYNLLHGLEEASGVNLSDVEDATQIEVKE